MEYIIEALKTVAAVIGLVIVLIVAFSYEDEEKRVIFILDKAWIFLSEENTKWQRKITRLSEASADVYITVINKIYGPYSISLRPVISSINVCVGSGVLIFSMLGIEDDSRAILVIIGIVFLTINLVSFLPFFYFTSSCALLFGIILLYFRENSLTFFGDVALESNRIAAGAAMAALIDFSAVICGRLMLSRWINSVREKRASLPYAAGFHLIPAAILLVSLTLIFTAEQLLSQPVSGDFSSGFHHLDDGFASLSAIVFSLGTITAFCLIYIISFLLVVVRGIMFMLPRFVYAFIKHKIIENKKSASALGAMLIGVRFPEFGKELLGALKSLIS